MNAPVDVSFFARAAKPLTSYRPYWAKRFGTTPFLPMSRAEMEKLGWDSCDIILVTGDAYVDHPSFGMAVIGRVLEAQGFRVGIIAQPDWHSAEAFKALGKPNLFWGVTSGNMDSMINRYTADRKIRSDDAYTPGDVGGKRPDRAAIVYSQRCREAYKDVPIVLGGMEGSLRRIAHYDYWSDKVRRSIVVDSKCDLLLYGNAERALVEVAHRIAAREPVEKITDVRGTAFVMRSSEKPSAEGWMACELAAQPPRASEAARSKDETSLVEEASISWLAGLSGFMGDRIMHVTPLRGRWARRQGRSSARLLQCRNGIQAGAIGPFHGNAALRCEQVGERLARVVEVGERVDHGDGAVLGEAVEHGDGERAERPGEVLLVDRQAERRVPARVLAEQVADRRVHQAHLLGRAQPGPARVGVEPAGAHHVDHHLRRLDDAPARVAVQPVAARQHLHPAPRRVAQRQRVGVEQQDRQRAEALEQLGPRGQPRRVGPRRQQPGLKVVAHVLRQRPRRQVVVLDQVAHQVVDRLHHRRPAREQLGDDGVRRRVADVTHGVEVRVGPEVLRHQ